MTAPDQCCSSVRKFLPRRRGLGLLLCKLTPDPHFPGPKSLLIAAMHQAAMARRSRADAPTVKPLR